MAPSEQSPLLISRTLAIRKAFVLFICFSFFICETFAQYPRRLQDYEILEVNNGVNVPFGRSVYLDPEKDLRINVLPGDRCSVLVLGSDALSQRPGKLMPPVFPCQFEKREVKYTHFGLRSPSEDRVRLQIRYDSSSETIIVPFTIDIDVTFVQLEIVTRNVPIIVDRLLGISTPIDESTLELTFDRDEEVCKLSILSSASGLPRYGRIINDTSVVSMVGCDEFLTQGIRYQHTATTNSPNRDYIPMVVEVMERDGTMTKQEYFQVMVKITGGSENTRPTVSHESLFHMVVDQFVMTAITPAIIFAEDIETPSDDLIFNITRVLGPGEGVIVSTDDNNQPVSSFYQKDVRDLKIAYKPPSSDSDSQRVFLIELEVVDAEGLTSDPFSLTVLVNPMKTMAPVVTRNTGIQLFEGESRPLVSSVNLEISDEDNLEDVRISVIDGLRHGRLLMSGVQRKFFSPADLDAGLVVYQHDGSDTYSDNIIFRMSDGRNNVEFLFPVTTFPVDDESPAINANTGLDISYGQMAEISPFVLSATDIDSDDSSIRFVLETPYSTEGDFVKRQFEVPQDQSGWEYVNGVYEKVVTEFTQEDIIEGKVFYRHVGPRKTDFVVDRVRLRAIDGSDPPNQSPVQEFIVKIAPVDDQPPYLHPNSPLEMTVQEFQLTDFKRKYFRFTDDDTNTRTLQYTVETPPYDTDSNTLLPAGKIVLCDDPESEVDGFSQAQVNHHKICYQPPSKELGIVKRLIQFVFSVKDKNGNVLPNQVFTVHLQPVDNKPPSLTNKGLTVSENGFKLILPEMMSAQDPDTTSDKLIYRLTEGPQYGELQRAGRPLSDGETFYQSDITDGLLTYVSTGEEMDSDKFSVDLSDGVHHVPFTFKVKVRSIDDEAPVLLNLESGELGGSLEVDEGHAVTLTSTNLQASDPDTEELMLTFIIDRPPNEGIILRNGHPSERFTQSDIFDGLVQYQHTGGEIGTKSKTDSFVLMLSDMSDDWVVGGNKIKNVEMFVDIMPVDSVAPTVDVVGKLSVFESEKSPLLPRYLLMEDPDTPVDELMCTIVVQPTKGYLENRAPAPGSEKSRVGMPITSFTMKDVRQRNINYVQSVHKGIEPRNDRFTLKCTDGSNLSPNKFFPVKILPLNDEAPEVFMREFVVMEGMDIIIDLPILNAIDKDEPRDVLTFLISKPPKHGKLVQQSPSGTYPITNFTLDSIEDGSTIVYEHDDSESKADSFNFTLTDGKHNITNSISIMILPVDDETPRLTINNGLEIENVGDTKYITSKELTATDLDSPDASISYEVRHPPNHGWLQIVLESIPRNLTKGSNFSQNDIDQGRLRYIHTGLQGVRDLIKFDVTDGSNPLIDRYFYVTVAGIDMVYPDVVNKGVELPEAGRVTLTTAILSGTDLNSPDQDLLFTVSRVPTRGHLEFSDNPGVPITSFTQLQLAGNKVRYVHTSQDEMKMDSFEFEVTDGYNPVFRTFRISLSDVDNKKPVLFFDTLRVKEGSNKLITPFELKAEDKDTPDNKITFTVTQVPVRGNILYNFSKIVSTFTLADLNENLISYQHDGTETLTDSFSFTVTDGTHSDFYVFPQMNVLTRRPQMMEIEIIPVDNGIPMISVNKGVASLSPLPDGSIGYRITNKVLRTDDRDSPVDELLYTITSEPQHGYVTNINTGDDSILSWTQADIDRMLIYYKLKPNVNMTSDTFFFKITDKGGNELNNQPFHLNWAWISLDDESFVANETADKLEVTLHRRGYLGETCFVTIVLQNGTAMIGEDINPRYAHQVQFNPGQTEKTWHMYLKDDARFEGMESLKLQLDDPVLAVLESPSVATVNVMDGEDESTVDLGEAKYEVEEGSGTLLIPVTRSGDVSEELMVICSTIEATATGTVPGTITSFSDYISRPEDFRNVISFEKNETEKFCEVTIIDDSLLEDNETFTVVLSQPMGGRLGKVSTAQVVILADKSDEPAFYFGEAEYPVEESAGYLEVKVWRTGTDLSHASSVTVRSRRTDPQTAEAGLDYIAVNKVLNFAPGVTMQTVRIIILDDLGRPRLEGEEAFELVLRMPMAAMLGEPSKSLVIINDNTTDVPMVSFEDAEYEVLENEGRVKATVIRTGDITHGSTVRCYTRQDSAEVALDFHERPNTDESTITFLPGEREKVCEVHVIDDGLFEKGEEFRLVLGTPLSPSAGGAKLGLNSTTITIKDGSDKPIIRFETTKYTVNEPVIPNENVILQIPIIRKGDLSGNSIIRVHTKDGSARAGRDYNGFSKEIQFGKNESRHVVDVVVLYDGEKEFRESFTIHLKPDKNMIADTRSNNKVIVYIEEMNKLADVAFPKRPMVISLKDYDVVGVEDLPQAIQGYPVVCLSPCNPKHPDYPKTGSLCEKEGINDTLTRFRWRTAAPSGVDGVTSNLQDVESQTFFTNTHSIGLDSIYFGGGSRVQCGARAVNNDGDPGLEILSEPITISDTDGLCMPRVMNSVGAEPFTAKLKYTGPDDPDHPNKVRLSVLIPHRDGMLPVISTNLLSNFELALSPDGFRIGQHSCSNLLDYDEVPTEFGFITNNTKKESVIGETQPYQYSSDMRTDPTLRFYKNLDLEACVWTFESFYDMSELVQKCGATISTDGQVRDLVQSFVSLNVPLHVSYIQHSPVATGGWQNSDLKSALQLTFVYDTAILWQNGIGSPETAELQGYLYPTSMRVRDDGRLAVNFKTKARFRGHFIPAHSDSGLESTVMSSSNPDLTFDLKLMRSEPTLDQPVQQWEFTSDYATRDYSGTYTIQLIPCTSTDQTYSEPLNCNPRNAVSFDLPIRFQQISDPVPTEFSLNTDFHLLRQKDLWLSDGSEGFSSETDAAFLPGDSIFGRVNVDPVQSLGDAFNLNIEKVFLCSGKDGYIPKYDPENQEYGCVADTPNLQHTFKVLDKGSPSTIDRDFSDLPFNAQLAIDDPSARPLTRQPGADGFSLSAQPLFGVDQGRQWFLHCIYTIRSKKNSDRGIGKRSVGDQLEWFHAVHSLDRPKRALDDIDGIGNSRGTNLARVKLRTFDSNGGDSNGETDGGGNIEDKKNKPVLTPVLIALVVVFAVLLLLVMLLVRKRRKRTTPPTSPPTSPTNTITVIGKGGKTRVISAGHPNSDPDNTEV